MQKIPFTNKFGQVINPGDKVITIAKGYGSNFHVRPGIYLGQKSGIPKVQVTVSVWCYDSTAKKGYYENRTRISSLPNGNVYPSAFAGELPISKR